MTEKQIFKKVYETSQKTKMDVYIVGGYVRDLLLDNKEKKIKQEISRVQAVIKKDIIEGGEDYVVEKIRTRKDMDFVVLGKGSEFAAVFADLMNDAGNLIEFEDFDTARYVFDEFEIEFAGARSEKYQKESRKPIVQAASLEKDLERRDFAINAMARQIVANGLDKTIVDPFSGQKDLKAKILKTPLDPNITFKEDPLRMLRAARFAASLGFKIDGETLEAIIKNKKRIKIVSSERITEELIKLLLTERPSIGLWILFKTGLLKEFLPEVAALDGVEEIYGRAHKNNLEHTFKVVDKIAQLTYKSMLRYAALMHDVGKPGTKKWIKGRGWAFDMHEHLGRKIVRQVGRRLHMSKDNTEYVAKLVRWHQQPIQLMDDGVTDSAVRRLVFNLGNEIDDMLKLCRSDITTGNPARLKKRLKNYDILENRIIKVIEKDKLRAFQSPVRGEEIMEICNLKPGPEVGRLKKEIEEAILDGKIANNYEEAKEYLLKIS